MKYKEMYSRFKLSDDIRPKYIGRMPNRNSQEASGKGAGPNKNNQREDFRGGSDLVINSQEEDSSDGSEHAAVPSTRDDNDSSTSEDALSANSAEWNFFSAGVPEEAAEWIFFPGGVPEEGVEDEKISQIRVTDKKVEDFITILTNNCHIPNENFFSKFDEVFGIHTSKQLCTRNSLRSLFWGGSLLLVVSVALSIFSAYVENRRLPELYPDPYDTTLTENRLKLSSLCLLVLYTAARIYLEYKTQGFTKITTSAIPQHHQHIGSAYYQDLLGKFKQFLYEIQLKKSVAQNLESITLNLGSGSAEDENIMLFPKLRYLQGKLDRIKHYRLLDKVLIQPRKLLDDKLKQNLKVSLETFFKIIKKETKANVSLLFSYKNLLKFPLAYRNLDPTQVNASKNFFKLEQPYVALMHEIVSIALKYSYDGLNNPSVNIFLGNIAQLLQKKLLLETLSQISLGDQMEEKTLKDNLNFLYTYASSPHFFSREQRELSLLYRAKKSIRDKALLTLKEEHPLMIAIDSVLGNLEANTSRHLLSEFNRGLSDVISSFEEPLEAPLPIDHQTILDKCVEMAFFGFHEPLKRWCDYGVLKKNISNIFKKFHDFISDKKNQSDKGKSADTENLIPDCPTALSEYYSNLDNLTNSHSKYIANLEGIFSDVLTESVAESVNEEQDNDENDPKYLAEQVFENDVLPLINQRHPTGPGPNSTP